MSWSIVYEWGWSPPGVTAEAIMDRSTRAAERALQLDSLSATAWLALARSRVLRVDVPMSEIEGPLRRAIAIDSSNAEAYHLLGSWMIESGQEAQAQPILERALALDPGRPITLTWRAVGRMHARDYRGARRWTDSALASSPGFFYALIVRSAVRTLQGDVVGARRDALEAMREDTLLATAVLAFAEARGGDSAAARRLLAHFTSTHDEAVAWAAAAHLAIGERERALERLETVTPSKYVGMYLEYAVFDPLREDPRFQAVYRRYRS